MAFKSNYLHCESLLKEAGLNWLEEACSEVESGTKQNSRVSTGQTKGSYEHKVIESEMTGYFGSNFENAIWEEYGTGEYAVNGDGRKGGWFYVDESGEGHFTHGKTANRPMDRAYTSKKAELEERAKLILKGKMI